MRAAPFHRPPIRGRGDSEDREGPAGSADRPDRYRSRIGAEQQREPHVPGAHGVAAGEISRGARYAENAVVSARGEPPRRDRLSKKAFGLGVDGAEALHLGHGEVGVHAAPGRREANAHALAGREDALAHIRGAFTAVVPQPLERNTRNMDPQVDPIEERTRDPPAIPLDLIREARALALGIAPEAAGTWVHRGDEDEPRRVCRGAARAGDGDGVL